jgi:hypothetical protein
MKPEKVHRLSEVYGVSRELPLTYVERPGVDGRFVNNLARDKHLVVYGGSKQGKTCLRKKCLMTHDFIVVQCANNTSIEQLYSLVLKEAGATVAEAESRTTRGHHKISVEVDAQVALPLIAKGSTGGGGEVGGGSGTSISSRHFEIDPADPNDVIRVLGQGGFNKFVVLEDFHYLSEDVQKAVAVDLKAFHEKSRLSFIVVGVWLEQNRLVLYNGDLAGRLIPIDADQWSEGELSEVIEIGEPLLNVSFPPAIKERLLDAAQGNVGILQEALYRLCERAGITFTQSELVEVGTIDAVDEIIREIAGEQAGRYQNFLSQFVQGFQKTDLEMYRWVAHVLVTARPDELKAGLKASVIHRRIEENHPERPRLLFNNTIQALSNVRKLQHRNRIQPIILDFDANENVLQVVDSGFILYTQATPTEVLVRLVSPEDDPG